MCMVDIRVVRDSKLPARFARAQTIIVLLTVSSTEICFIEIAQCFNHWTLDHVAKAVQEGDPRVQASRMPRYKTPHGTNGPAVGKIVLSEFIFANYLGDRLPGCGIGKRAYHSYGRIRFTAGDHSIQPARSDHGVAVQQDYIIAL